MFFGGGGGEGWLLGVGGAALVVLCFFPARRGWWWQDPPGYAYSSNALYWEKKNSRPEEVGLNVEAGNIKKKNIKSRTIVL